MNAPAQARFATALEAIGIEDNPRHPLLLAVSGGPDSLALLLLAPAGSVAATVDHGLRPAAAGEAASVAAICAGLAIPHATLAVAVARAGQGIQAAARAARYAALADQARAVGARYVVTAHHADDQAETLLMRLARGSGSGGLAGVRARRDLGGGVTLVRPLLRWRRAELAAIVAAAGLVPADDPSNRDARHDRTRFRALLAREPLLDAARLAAAAAHLAEAETALGWAAEGAARERMVADGGQVLLRDPHGLPRELRRRLVAAAIAAVDPAAAPRGDSVDRLLRLLDSGRAGTLAGIAAKPGADWRFLPAPPRRR